MRVKTEFNRIRIRFSGWFLWIRQWTYGFHKGERNFLINWATVSFLRRILCYKNSQLNNYAADNLLVNHFWLNFQLCFFNLLGHRVQTWLILSQYSSVYLRGLSEMTTKSVRILADGSRIELRTYRIWTRNVRRFTAAMVLGELLVWLVTATVIVLLMPLLIWGSGLFSF